MKNSNNQIVYLFRHKGTDLVKIGMTSNNDCLSRFQSFCTYSPYGGEIVGIIKCKNARVLEKKLHDEYVVKRLKGEFFKLSQEECDKILKDHNVDYIDDIKDILHLLLSDSEDNVLKIKAFINRLKVAKESETKHIDKIIQENFVHDENSKMTCEMVSEFIYENFNLKIESTKIGIILSKLFERKRGYLLGSSRTYYNISVNPCTSTI